MSSENYNKNKHLKALDLKNAFVAGLSILGRASIEVLLEELKRQGIDLDNENRSYSLTHFERMLGVILGEDVAPLMIERIQLQLRNANR